jgi:hypothetical protein
MTLDIMTIVDVREIQLSDDRAKFTKRSRYPMREGTVSCWEEFS